MSVGVSLNWFLMTGRGRVGSVRNICFAARLSESGLFIVLQNGDEVLLERFFLIIQDTLGDCEKHSFGATVFQSLGQTYH